MMVTQTTQRRRPATKAPATKAPATPPSVVQRAAALLAEGRAEEAATLLGRAAAAEPRDPAALRLSALALLRLNQPKPAIGALYLALDLDPLHAATHGTLAKALFDDGERLAAAPHAELAYRLEPNAAHATTYSCVLNDSRNPEEAIRVTRRALQERPRTLELLINQSVALEALERFEQSIECGRRAVTLFPGSGLARHHLAASLLAAGSLTPEAWDLYEGRLTLPGRNGGDLGVMRWHGEDPAGKTVLLHAEQGVGDTLQFIRYAPLVAARGARVVAAVQRSLLPLLKHAPGLDAIVAVGDPLPLFDLQTPLLSLPGLFATTLATIPPPPRIRPQRTRTRVAGDTLQVGLVWAGNPAFIVDRRRSMPSNALLDLAGIDGVQFHNLQWGAEPPAALGAIDAMRTVTDFAGTAHLIERLDLVIAVDTAVAHLAGTLGVPVWLLSRHRGCWRWLHDRADTPWYPSMTIYRQATDGDWPGVIERVRRDLSHLAMPPWASPLT